MRYRDLVQFEPIETVVQLTDAGRKAEAQRLISTYVISERMADQLANLVIPELQFQSPRDNKGVLIVGNYGTGKSHLMAVLSGLAEHADLLEDVQNPAVKAAAQPIAGKFCVLRIEIGAVTSPLRDVILGNLERALAGWGVAFTFPPADHTTNNKDLLIQATHAFREKHPDRGILVVVDEMLDFLRSKEERALILDLSFLRELGETAKSAPFRFIVGLQETLFDNPRFQFVAGQLRWVRDRYEQLRIARDDIAYVVANRLLRKTDAQRAKIEEHLNGFSALYGGMAPRLREYVELFPVHPAYLDTFERIYLAEKREVLKTLSRAMSAVLDQPVPTDQPGLISYDQYWGVLRDNPSLRGVPEVALVIDKSNVLEGRVSSAYTRPHLRDVALRIIHALSVHRLTTDDLYAPLGPTAEELRDDLCLHTPMPSESQSAEFLLDQVMVALREIRRTVSYQFISFNEVNGQYFLNLKEDRPYDSLIQDKGEAVDREDLNRHLFVALQTALGLSDSTYSAGHRIWMYELPWDSHKVTRPGYLILAAPDERSTAAPPRDFNLYCMPPFNGKRWQGEVQRNEVLFEITGVDKTFESRVRLYAGARLLENVEPVASHRKAYSDKADEHLRVLLRWFTENLPHRLQVTHEGVTQPVSAVLAQMPGASAPSVRELIDRVAAHKMAPYFEEQYPRYPKFPRMSQWISEKARGIDAMEAIKFLAGRGKTALAVNVLDGLGLLDDDGRVRPDGSPFARGFLNLLKGKAEGQVVNRGELIEVVSQSVDKLVEKDRLFGLEHEWVAVVLMALVHGGEINLKLPKQPLLDPTTMSDAGSLNIEDLAGFHHFSAPKVTPIALWKQIFTVLGLPEGLLTEDSATAREHAVQQLSRVVGEKLQRLAETQDRVQRGLQLWNQPVLTDVTFTTKDGIVQGLELPDAPLSKTDLSLHLKAFKSFLEELARVNTVGKLRTLRLATPDVEEAAGHRDWFRRTRGLIDAVDRLQPLAAYLATAQQILPAEHPWTINTADARARLLPDVRRIGRGESDAQPVVAVASELEALRREYVEAYSDLHRQQVLGPKDDERRARLYTDPRLKALDALAAIELLPRAELENWKTEARSLPTCRTFQSGALVNEPKCPDCGYRPALQAAGSAAARLDHLDDALGDMLDRWQSALRRNLESDAAKASLAAMTPDERRPIERFLKQKESEAALPDGFVDAARQALQGIVALTLPEADLLAALKKGGLPCTLEELRRRFEHYLASRMKGHDARNTRLTLES